MKDDDEYSTLEIVGGGINSSWEVGNVLDFTNLVVHRWKNVRLIETLKEIWCSFKTLLRENTSVMWLITIMFKKKKIREYYTVCIVLAIIFFLSMWIYIYKYFFFCVCYIPKRCQVFLFETLISGTFSSRFNVLLVQCGSTVQSN